MQINVTGHHFDLSDPLRDHVVEKFKRIERHFDQMTTVHVVLGVEKQQHKAEATIHVAGNNLYGEAHHEDMYAAVDTLIDKLDRQVKKHKEKLTDHHRSEGGVEKLTEPQRAEGAHKG